MCGRSRQSQSDKRTKVVQTRLGLMCMSFLLRMVYQGPQSAITGVSSRFRSMPICIMTDCNSEVHVRLWLCRQCCLDWAAVMASNNQLQA